MVLGLAHVSDCSTSWIVHVSKKSRDRPLRRQRSEAYLALRGMKTLAVRMERRAIRCLMAAGCP